MRPGLPYPGSVAADDSFDDQRSVMRQPRRRAQVSVRTRLRILHERGALTPNQVARYAYLAVLAARTRGSIDAMHPAPHSEAGADEPLLKHIVRQYTPHPAEATDRLGALLAGPTRSLTIVAIRNALFAGDDRVPTPARLATNSRPATLAGAAVGL